MVKMVVAYLSGSPDSHLRGSDMRRSDAWAGGLVLGMGLLAATPAHALITRPTPLRGLIDESRYILTARVEAVTADQVKAAFARKLQPDRMVTVIVGAGTGG